MLFPSIDDIVMLWRAVVPLRWHCVLTVGSNVAWPWPRARRARRLMLSSSTACPSCRRFGSHRCTWAQQKCSLLAVKVIFLKFAASCCYCYGYLNWQYFLLQCSSIMLCKVWENNRVGICSFSSIATQVLLLLLITYLITRLHVSCDWIRRTVWVFIEVWNHQVPYLILLFEHVWSFSLATPLQSFQGKPSMFSSQLICCCSYFFGIRWLYLIISVKDCRSSDIMIIVELCYLNKWTVHW